MCSIVFKRTERMKRTRGQKELSKEQLVRLSQGDGHNLIYDLSRMKPRDFTPIMLALKNYAKSHIFNLTFSLDYYYEYCQTEYPFLKKSTKPNHKVDQVIPFTLSHSAYYEKPETVGLLIATLEQILPRSLTLFTLNFRSMLFGNVFTRLSKAFAQAHSLRTLTFVNCDIRDSGFAVLAEALQSAGITSLMCQRCGLTDASVAPLTDLLKFQLMSQRKAEHDMQHGIEGASLTQLDFRDNDFSSKLLASIADFLGDLRISLIDIRNNQPIDFRLLFELQKSCPHVDIRVTDDKDALRRTSSGRIRALSVGKPPTMSTNRMLDLRLPKQSNRPRVVMEVDNIMREPPKQENTVEQEVVEQAPVTVDVEEPPNPPVVLELAEIETDGKTEAAPQTCPVKVEKKKVGDDIKIADGIHVRGERARLFVEYLCDVCAMTKEIQDRMQGEKKRKRPKKSRKAFSKNKAGSKKKRTRIPIVSNRRLCPFI